MHRKNRTTINTWEKLVSSEIDKWGRDVTVVYGATANCSSCAYDPINKSGTNSFCDTCDGRFFFDIEQTKRIKGAMKTFIGNMGQNDYSLQKYSYMPDHDARITCWMSDILYNTDSATGPTYLDRDNIIRIETDGKDYMVQSTYRTGIEHLQVIVATLREVKRIT